MYTLGDLSCWYAWGRGLVLQAGELALIQSGWVWWRWGQLKGAREGKIDSYAVWGGR